MSDAPPHRPGRGQRSRRCGDPPPPRLRRGIEQFNRSEFFEQHETLELEWLKERDPVRYLYQRILQIGIGFEHLRRGNPRGARRLWRQGISQLEPFRGGCMEVDVDRLVADTERCLAELERVGGLERFDRSLIPRLERFRFWVRQDYRFLLGQGRLLALGAARAPDLETMRRLADLCQATLRDEMDLHRSYAREFDISEEEELEAEPMAPTTQGYTDFLVRTAAQGDFAELVAALLPCMWGFGEIGQRLAEGGRPSDERYAQVDRYVLLGGVRRARDVVPHAHRPRGRRAIPASLGAVAAAFLTSSRYELAFWQMAWEGERWLA